MVQRADKSELEPQINPLRRPDYTEAQVQALRAVNRGEATEHQQIEAMNFIINGICNTYGMSWRTDIRMTDLALGQQSIGQTIVWFINSAPTAANPDKLATRIMNKLGGKENPDEPRTSD